MVIHRTGASNWSETALFKTKKAFQIHMPNWDSDFAILEAPGYTTEERMDLYYPHWNEAKPVSEDKATLTIPVKLIKKKPGN
jgi:hypothetical protein